MPRWNKKPDQRVPIATGIRQFRIGVMLQTMRAICDELLEEVGLSIDETHPSKPDARKRRRRRKVKRAA